MQHGGDEVQALVEYLSAELERSVLVDDASLRLLAYSPALGGEDEVRRTAILTRETPRLVREWHFAQGIASAPAAIRTASRPEYGLESRLCVPIRCQGTLFGYLWLIDSDQSLSERQTALAEACAAEIGAAMYRHQESENPRRALERRLVEELLDGEQVQREHAAEQLLVEELVVSTATIATFVMRPARDPQRNLDGPERARVSLAIDQFRRTLPARHALSVMRADHGVLIVAVEPSSQRAATVRDLAVRLRDAMDAAFGTEGTARVAVGFGEEHPSLLDAHAGYRHARLALRVAIYLPEFHGLAGWSDLGAYRMLARLAETGTPEELLHPGLPRLFELHGGESLITTLETYLDKGCDTKLTAEALFLHRASLYYRLQRIEAVTGASLKVGLDRLALHAGLKLARLLGVHPDQLK